MSSGTCIAFVLFHIYRYYKRVGLPPKRTEFISDMKRCHLLLQMMENNINPTNATGTVQFLIDRLNRFGVNINFQVPLRFVDIYDREIISIMLRISAEIIDLAKRRFYAKNQGEIFKRFLVLHNLPRVLLNDTSGDSCTLRNFHISKQDALDCISSYLGDDWVKTD